MTNPIMNGLLNAKPAPAKHKIAILWGECPQDGDKAVTYKFKTKGELDAFMLGVDEMDGWMGYDIVSEGHIYREEE